MPLSVVVVARQYMLTTHTRSRHITVPSLQKAPGTEPRTEVRATELLS